MPSWLRSTVVRSVTRSTDPVATLSVVGRALRQGARFVVCPLISGATGARLPVEGIGSMAHDRDATVLVDATQLAGTARVITSAALIMIAVFGGFVLDDDPRIKMFGLGLATAILVDATIIRLVLVPATMTLLGDANWWLPRWLGRWLREHPAAATVVP